MLDAGLLRSEILPTAPRLLAAALHSTLATLATLATACPPAAATPDATCAALDLARCLLHAPAAPVSAAGGGAHRLRCLLASFEAPTRARDRDHAAASAAWPGRRSLGAPPLATRRSTYAYAFCGARHKPLPLRLCLGPRRPARSRLASNAVANAVCDAHTCAVATSDWVPVAAHGSACDRASRAAARHTRAAAPSKRLRPRPPC